MLIIIVVFLTVLYFIYRYAFGTDPKRIAGDDEIPEYKSYEQYGEQIRRNVAEMKTTPSQKVTITTKDGVRLYGRYYHVNDGAPIVIMFHGYRGSSFRDGMGAFKISRDNGYNILMVDQRAHRESSGKTITFGVKERYDCLEWVRHVISHFGKETQIILVGLSMGASTVLMATGLDLPNNVKGVIADCGYSAPKDILGKVIGMMKLPVEPVYLLVRLSAMLFGGFDPDSASATEALRNCKIPVLLIHGEGDHLVPCEMSRMNYEACNSEEKEIFTVPDAEHGMSYLLDEKGYRERVEAFLKRNFER